MSLAADGTMVVRVDDDPTYRSVLRFIADAFSAVEAEGHVITDDTPAARELRARRL